MSEIEKELQKILIGMERMSDIQSDLLTMIANLQSTIINQHTRISNVENGLSRLQKHSDITEENEKILETRIANQESIVTKTLEVLANMKHIKPI